MITVDFKRLSIRPGSRILDIGCGTGRHTAACLQPQVFTVGADLKLSELGGAKERLMLHDRLGHHGQGRWGLCVTDTTGLPFISTIFDLVICSEVLEHLHDHRRAVTEIVRVLRPGCPLVVSVPRYWPEKICWSISKEYRLSEGGHVRIYSQGELIDLLTAAGLQLWAVDWAHSLHTPYWWLKCLVGPTRKDHQLVNLYHRFLTWDIMHQPPITRIVDRLLNPLLGKSLVLYLKKNCKNDLLRQSLRLNTPKVRVMENSSNRPSSRACR